MLFESSVAWVCDWSKSLWILFYTRKPDPYASNVCIAPSYSNEYKIKCAFLLNEQYYENKILIKTRAKYPQYLQ